MRAVIINGETYINGADLAQVMRVRAQLETQILASMTEGAPREIIPELMAASQNCISGMALITNVLRKVVTQPILPLSNEEGLLVDPLEMANVPSTVPAAWLKEE